MGYETWRMNLEWSLEPLWDLEGFGWLYLETLGTGLRSDHETDMGFRSEDPLEIFLLVLSSFFTLIPVINSSLFIFHTLYGNSLSTREYQSTYNSHLALLTQSFSIKEDEPIIRLPKNIQGS